MANLKCKFSSGDKVFLKYDVIRYFCGEISSMESVEIFGVSFINDTINYHLIGHGSDCEEDLLGRDEVIEYVENYIQIRFDVLKEYLQRSKNGKIRK